MVDPVARLKSALRGRYRVERQLGEGGMATVYLADDLRHERKVALKVLKPELAAVVGAERFLAEIKTTANLQHPHILPLFDSGEADTFLFYVMPHVEGESLRQRLDREHQLPVSEAVQIAIDVAEALDYAHRHGVIHRDIKPANILLQDGKPVVSDFGIALAVSAGGAGRLTETGLSLGTPHYMSPEQATGDVSVGPATDIYALGCVLYEMLVGEPPYTGSTPQAVLGRIVTGTPTPVREHRKSVGAHVEATIARALEKVPADRFQSGSEFVRALVDASFRHGQAALTGAGFGSDRWKRIAMAGWGVATVAVILTVLPGPGGLDVVPRTVSSTISVAGAGSNSFDGAGRAVAFDSDGSGLVLAVPDQVVRRPMDRLDAQLLAAEPMSGFFVSPNGAWLGSVLQGRLTKMPAEGGLAQTVFDPVEAFGQRADVASWSEADTIVFEVLGNSPLYKVSADGGSAVPATFLDTLRGETDHRYPELLPGGREVLYTAFIGATGSEQVIVESFDTGERRNLVAGSNPRYSATGHLFFVRDASLMAAPFDARSLRLTGPESEVGQGLWRHLDTGVAHLAISRDGLVAYVTGGGNVETDRTVVWLDRDGREEPILLEPRPYQMPRVAPAGPMRLALMIDNVVHVYDIDRRALTPLTADDGDVELFPFWSWDGLRVAYGSTRGLEAGVRNIWWRLADGSREAERLSTSSYTQSLWGWTPDRTFAVIQEGAQLTGRWDIGRLPLDGGPAELLIDSNFQERNPALSPDGRLITYMSDRTGRNEIFVQPFPEVDAARWQVSTQGGIDPRWSRDGRELFYLEQRREGLMALMAAPVIPGRPAPVGVPTQLLESAILFEQYDYDVAPDGRFVVTKRLSADVRRPELVLVQNWQLALGEPSAN